VPVDAHPELSVRQLAFHCRVRAARDAI
jgi:hypothetical protein